MYGLEDIGETTSLGIKYSVSNGTVTVTGVTAGQYGSYGYTNGRVYLEAGKTYVFNCDTDGTWGTNNMDTVESYLVKDGSTAYNVYYRMNSNNNYEFTPDTSGEYWIRLDVNQQGKTYQFWNISITEKNPTTKQVVYGEEYGELPTPTKTGYTFKGWKTLENVIPTDSDYWEIGGIHDATGNNSVRVDRIRLKKYLSVSPNTEYNITTNNDVNIRIRRVWYYDINKNYIDTEGWNNSNITFTTPNNCAYIRIVLQYSNQSTEMSLDDVTISGIFLEEYVNNSTKVTLQQNHTLTAIWEVNE